MRKVNMTILKKRLGELLLQIIPVMIGVYLGFVVSDWTNNRDKKSQTELLRQNILAEIEYNKNMVDNVVKYHEMIRDSSRFYASDEAGFDKIYFFSGINTLTLTSSAFESGIQTGLINELPLDKLQSLNKVYNKQKSYNDFAQVVLSGIIMMDFDNTTTSVKKLLNYLAIVMTDIAIKENNLLFEYDNILEVLKD